MQRQGAKATEDNHGATGQRSYLVREYKNQTQSANKAQPQLVRKGAINTTSEKPKLSYNDR
jgi:hypothetical protein